MPFRIESRHLGEVAVVCTTAFEDERGSFMETYRADSFQSLGLPREFLQDNHSRSRRGVLRGLHFQWEPPMGKLMRVTQGTAFLVAVDIRVGSPTLGRWFGMVLSEESRKQVWAPAGFARGFCVLSDWAEVQYKTTAIYNPATEGSIRWDDPAIGIEWPIRDAQLSPKDRNAQTLAEWLGSPHSEAFRYHRSALSGGSEGGGLAPAV